MHIAISQHRNMQSHFSGQLCKKYNEKKHSSMSFEVWVMNDEVWIKIKDWTLIMWTVFSSRPQKYNKENLNSTIIINQVWDDKQCSQHHQSRTSWWWKQRTINDVTQFCVCCGRSWTLTAKSVGRRRHCCCWTSGLRLREGAGNGSQEFTASTLTVLRLIGLTVALASGSARLTGFDASTIICAHSVFQHHKQWKFLEYIWDMQFVTNVLLSLRKMGG